MFFREELQLDLPVAVARQRILTQLRADGLQAASSTILSHSTPGGDGYTGNGDGTQTRPNPHVIVHIPPANMRGVVTVVPIRWFVDGSADDQPILDADLEIGPAETTNTTLLVLVGLFRPIKGRTDQSLHQTGADRIPRDLLTTVAAHLGLIVTSNDAKRSIIMDRLFGQRDPGA